jgi:hypothetical protein
MNNYIVEVTDKHGRFTGSWSISCRTAKEAEQMVRNAIKPNGQTLEVKRDYRTFETWMD